jgi:purine-nucleoside phosphorylase
MHEMGRIARENIDGVVRLERICFPEDPWSRSTLRGILVRRADTLCIGAFFEGELVGYAAAAVEDCRETHLLSIAVCPEHRHRGVGARLISALAHWGSARGSERVYLEVRSGGAAAGLYRRMGFDELGPAAFRYKDGAGAMIMARSIYPRPEVARTATALHGLLGGRIPRVGVILGSGAGWLAEGSEAGVSIRFDRIPGMEGGTVAGHAGTLVCSGDTVYLMGRRHHYQGYNGDQISLLPSALASLGTDSWLLTTSVGAVDPGLRTGDAVVFKDHVNMSGCVPSPPLAPMGSMVYSTDLRRRALRIGEAFGAPVREGTFCCVSGPAYESASEVRYLMESGVSVVSMSTVQEALELVSQGCRVLGVGLVTNEVGEGDSVHHTEVLEAHKKVMARQGAFLPELVRELGK